MTDRVERPGAQPPAGGSLEQLRDAAQGCHGCELWEPATQTVFGRGPADARMVLVGEQPGDVEDQKGAPFVGPAGRVLVRALEEAQIDKSTVYVTNAVKHFRFTASASGRRLHKTPDPVHVTACRPWLAAELREVRPDLIVLLGATAAKALLGNDFRVTKQRGQLLDGPPGSDARLMATVHPSSILRVPPEDRDAAFAGLVADLVIARDAVAG